MVVTGEGGDRVVPVEDLSGRRRLGPRVHPGPRRAPFECRILLPHDRLFVQAEAFLQAVLFTSRCLNFIIMNRFGWSGL